MKTVFLLPWTPVLGIGTMLLLAACGGEETTENITYINQMSMDVVKSAKDLPECSEENEGAQAFVKGEPAARICVDGKWLATAVHDGEGAAPEFSCSTKELKDKNGLKIVCNGDSIGVVLNGTDGKDGSDGEDGVDGKDGAPGEQGLQGEKGDAGKDGADGKGCSIVSQTDSTVTIVCGTGKFTMSLNGGNAAAIIDTGDVAYEVENASISGVSQKGPFVKGSLVTAYELDGSKSLLQTGRTFSGTISQDDGRFSMNNVTLKSSYVSLSANGYYRNEVTGKNSTSPITLNAVTDLSSRNTVNVNLLTHLEYGRVARLMAESDGSLKIKTAKKQAEKEIFDAFHIDATGFGYSEDLDVFGKNDADAALLAISILLQGNRSESELTELLAELSDDLSDGKWDNAEKRAEIADSVMSWDLRFGKLANYRSNVENWGLSMGNLPHFEKYIRRFTSVEKGLGVCGSDSTPVGFVKQVTNSKSKDYAKSYTDTTSVGGKTRFICVDADSAKWREARAIEKDTMGWAMKFKNVKEGDIHNGKVTGMTYVYENQSWRYGDPLDSLLVMAGGEACLLVNIGDTSNVKYDKNYYVCTEQYGWKKAPDIYNDTYESRDSCSETGKYGDGTILAGRVNTRMKYVCDDGEFRLADKNLELKLNKGCVSYYMDESFTMGLLHSSYTCTSDGWVFDSVNVITDPRDGQVYKTIKIGSQYWMAENLNYGVDGQSYCYNNSADSCAKYGRLYTWAAAMDSAGIWSTSGKGCGFSEYGFATCNAHYPVRGICPEGWHLPGSSEWYSLLLDYPTSGCPYAMQAKGYEKWTSATNAYGFSALPSGNLRDNSFYGVGSIANFWGSDDGASYAILSVNSASVEYGSGGSYSYGYSVRCVKD